MSALKSKLKAAPSKIDQSLREITALWHAALVTEEDVMEVPFSGAPGSDGHVYESSVFSLPFGTFHAYIAALRLPPRMSSKNGVPRSNTHFAAYKYIAADHVCQSRPLGFPVCA